jgi:2-polyprenyl-3-methyl-5-hydroxy-6-metoxy-1,4-benzoquinol methylase
MHNKNISSLYQNNLVSHKIDINRLDMAEREVKTLTILMNLIQAPFPESGVFLDLGCGDRYLEAPVSKRGIDYIGLDIDTVNFENNSIPVETGSVDFAVSLAVLEHLRDPSIFLSEIYRCLKPGGVVYLSTPNFNTI